jgi:hypothetical protein
MRAGFESGQDSNLAHNQPNSDLQHHTGRLLSLLYDGNVGSKLDLLVFQSGALPLNLHVKILASVLL